MQYTLIGRHLKITEGMKDAIKHKLNFLEKFLKSDSIITVTVNVVSDIECKVDVLFALNGEFIKSEAIEKDFYIALDEVADRVKKQVVKKRKLVKTIRNLNTEHCEEKVNSKEMNKIVKRKKFSMKPMSEEEAILQMELLGHNSFMFINANLDSVMCLLYKRNGNKGEYGIIEGIFDEE